jgi:hypothetical protein
VTTRLESIIARHSLPNEILEDDFDWLVSRIEECQNAIMKIQLCSMYILESKNGRKIKDICDEVLLEWTTSAALSDSEE